MDRQVLQFLGGESKAGAEEAAGANGQQALHKLIAIPLGIAPGVEKGDHANALVLIQQDARRTHQASCTGGTEQQGFGKAAG